MFLFSRFRLLSKFMYTPRRHSSWNLGGKQTSKIPPKEHYWKTNLKNLLKIVGLLGGTCIFFIRSIDIPYCDRKRYTIVPESWEDYIGTLCTQIYLEKYKDCIVDPQHPLALQVESVGNSICEQCSIPEHKFILVNSPEANAYSIPGKSVFVNTAILPIFANHSGCAMILSHEISHSLAAHGIQSLYLVLPALLIAYFLGDFGITLSNYLVDLPRSRHNEIEADSMGIQLMARSCYDIEQSTAVFMRLAEVTGDNATQDWLGTHSSWKYRIINLNNLKESQEVCSFLGNCKQIDARTKSPYYNFFTTFKYPKQFPKIKDDQYQKLYNSITTKQKKSKK